MVGLLSPKQLMWVRFLQLPPSVAEATFGGQCPPGIAKETFARSSKLRTLALKLQRRSTGKARKDCKGEIR